MSLSKQLCKSKKTSSISEESALSEKEDNENHRPWQIFKPKQTINLKGKQVQNPIHYSYNNLKPI
jgi:hypothetical protein